MMVSALLDIRVFGVVIGAYSRETLGIEKDFYGIPEIYTHDEPLIDR